MPRDAHVGSMVSRMLSGSDVGDRLSALADLRSELDAIETELAADALRSGLSWREIGAALGISKQAAHRRHSHGVRLLDQAAETYHEGSAVIVSAEARAAVRIARREAAAMGKDAVGTEHLLLGLLQSGDRPTIGVMRRLGVTLGGAREVIQPTIEISADEAARQRAIAGAAQRGDGPRFSALVSPLAQRVLERALGECLERRSSPLSALDLLQALLKHPHGGAAQTLERLGVDPQSAQAEIRRPGGSVTVGRPLDATGQ
jgi:ATP-dependent Clp protease ATP-binding subunit ClpA